MSASMTPGLSRSSCPQCGKSLQSDVNFCSDCGATVHAAPSPIRPVAPDAAGTKQQQFERNLKVAWSCLKDVENKIEEIREASDERENELQDGRLRGFYAKAALQGTLESEFLQSLEMAWKSAVKAEEIDANGSLKLDGIDVTSRIIFGAVCGLHGDLKFALGRWDEAVGFYNQSLQHIPGDPVCYYSIGAAYTNKHDPALAIQAFQKVVELDPTGHYGIEATKSLEKLKTGVLGQKRFTGSWKVVAVLGGLTLFSFVTIALLRGLSVFFMFFWGGILTLYCLLKFK